VGKKLVIGAIIIVLVIAIFNPWGLRDKVMGKTAGDSTNADQ
jgi:hypothetical protein